MTMQYSTPSLNTLVDGAILDVRVKFAMRLLEGPVGAALLTETPADAAKMALDIASVLFAEAKARGMIEPLSLSPEISDIEAAHIRRNVSGQVIGQLHGQRVMEAMQNRLPVLVPRQQ